jgi:hypothetical protein
MAFVLVFAEVAWANPTVAECVGADTAAQSLRRDGKLAAARVQLMTCGSPSCPALVRDDCTQRLEDLERAVPRRRVPWWIRRTAGCRPSA